MDTPKLRSRAVSPPRQDPIHLFAVGQNVRLKRSLGMPREQLETYQITARMPMTDGRLQYRIRSQSERHERVSWQEDLEALPASAGESLARHTFGGT